MDFEELHNHFRSEIKQDPPPFGEGVVEWVAGTLLNAYRARLSDTDFERFCARHRERLLEELPDDRPYPFTFPRILLWARKPR